MYQRDYSISGKECHFIFYPANYKTNFFYSQICAEKIISITLCAALALSAAACGNNNSEAVQIPSPFVDCDTMDAAKELTNKDMVKVIPLFASGFDPYLQLQLLMPDKLFCLL